MEDATVLEVHEFPAQQYVLRLEAPKTAASASAGTFVHVQCDDTIPMRRPLSIMRASAKDGWIEVLFKIVGEGLRSLGARKRGDSVSVIGPIGHGFEPDPERPLALLVGGGVGIPPMIFLAETLVSERRHWRPLVLMGSEIPFPFELVRSSLPTPWLDAETNSSIALLEDLGVPARLASLAGFEGCHKGYVTDLARRCLESLDGDGLSGVALYACGPTPMLEAVARLAGEFGLPCQVALEEYMACAVGGCAGCTVLVQTADGPAMKRVCVDGPVFDAAAVWPQTGE